MSELVLAHHSGWPWPLDAVQDWFDGLWDMVSEVAEDAAREVWDLMPPALKDLTTRLADLTLEVWRKILDFFRDPIGALKGAFDAIGVFIRDNIGWWDPVLGRFVGGFLGWLWDSHALINTQLSAVAEWITVELGDAVGDAWKGLQSIGEWLWTQVEAGLKWLSSTIWSWVDGSLKWLTDTFRWLRDEITEVGSWIVTEVGTAFDGASMVIGDVLTSLFGPAMESFSDFAEYLKGIKIEIDPFAIVADVADHVGAVAATILVAFTPGSPRSPEEAMTIAWNTIDEVTTIYMSQATSLMIAEAASLGQVDITPAAFMHTPQLEASNKLVGELYSVMAEASLVIPLKQYYMRAFKPMIPPAPDLIRMVVREAFDPEVVIEAPGIFADYMELSGFSKEWSDRYWTAHFLPIELRQAYDNLWRGYWTKEQFMRALHIADIHPMWREDIYRVAYRPLTRRELRYGWEVGEVDDAKMVASFMAMGLSPEDAVIATESSKEYALHEERMGVLREWLYDYQDGLLTEATLRANMDSIRILGVRQDYYVARATIRRERMRMKDMLDLYRDGFMKDMITEEELRDRALEIIVIPEVADLWVEKAYVDKWKRPKPPTETTEEKALKELRKYQITYAIQAYRRYAVEKPELVEMLEAADVALDVARVRSDYEELKRPKPKPSPTEIASAKETAKLQSVAVRTAVEEYRRYVLDDSELLKRLIEAGLTEALATAQMQLESIRRPPPPIPPEEIERRRLEESVRRYMGLMLVEQYRRYAIRKEEFIAGLIVAGFDPAEAAARSDYEEARRPVPKPVAEELERRREEARIRKLAESEALTLFRAEAVTSEELAKRLRALEYSEDLIAAIVRYEEIKLALKG